MTAPALEQNTPLCFPIIGTRGLRVTLVDKCGKPVYGPNSQAVSAGVVSIELEAEVEEGDDYSQKTAAGDECFPSFKGPDIIKWWNVTIEFCNVDPGLFGLMMRTWRPVMDYTRTLRTGWRMGSRVSSVDGFALETWPKSAGAGISQLCDTSGNEVGDTEGYDPGGYFLLPWVIPQAPDTITLENEPTTFTLKGRTKAGSLWKKGPHDVVLNGPGQPGPLVDPINPGFKLSDADDPNGVTGPNIDVDHFHGELTVVAPPAFGTCGTFPLWNSGATKAELSTSGDAREATLTIANLDKVGGKGDLKWGDGTEAHVDASPVKHTYAASLDGKKQTITFYPANNAEPTTVEFTPKAPASGQTAQAKSVDRDTAEDDEHTIRLTLDNPPTGQLTADWGDGSSDQVRGAGPHRHTYEQPGAYDVVVTDSKGKTVTRDHITVPISKESA